MPAVSKKQQRFMGIVRGIQTGDIDPDAVSDKALSAANNMKKKDVKEFASTSHIGLPMKKKASDTTKPITVPGTASTMSSSAMQTNFLSMVSSRKRRQKPNLKNVGNMDKAAAVFDKIAKLGPVTNPINRIGKFKKVLTGQTARKLGIGFAGGAIASNLATAVTYPLDTQQIREQTGLPKAEGVKELYQGVSPKIKKNVLFGGISFAGASAIDSIAKARKWIK